MSKVDAQRAMREAKYARTQANAAAAKSAERPVKASAGTAVDAPASAPAAKPAKTPAAKPAKATAAAATGELCGHKSMNGRSCTREPGHPEKSHRYS